MYLKIIFSAVAREAAILVVRKERPGETGDCLSCGWLVTSAFDI